MGKRFLITWKDFRYLISSKEVKIGSICSVLGSVDIIIYGPYPIFIPILFIIIIFLFNSFFILNSFGHDGSAVKRYLIFSIKGKDLLIAKNQAFFLICSLQLIPVFIVLFIKADIYFSLSLLSTSSAIIVLYALWGNVSSVLAPKLRQSKKDRGTDEEIGLISKIYVILIWGAPYYLHKSILPLGKLPAALGLLLLTGCCWFLYFRLLKKMGEEFDRNAYIMLRRFVK